MSQNEQASVMQQLLRESVIPRLVREKLDGDAELGKLLTGNTVQELEAQAGALGKYLGDKRAAAERDAAEIKRLQLSGLSPGAAALAVENARREPLVNLAAPPGAAAERDDAKPKQPQLSGLSPGAAALAAEWRDAGRRPPPGSGNAA